MQGRLEDKTLETQILESRQKYKTMLYSLLWIVIIFRM